MEAAMRGFLARKQSSRRLAELQVQAREAAPPPTSDGAAIVMEAATRMFLARKESMRLRASQRHLGEHANLVYEQRANNPQTGGQQRAVAPQADPASTQSQLSEEWQALDEQLRQQQQQQRKQVLVHLEALGQKHQQRWQERRAHHQGVRLQKEQREKREGALRQLEVRHQHHLHRQHAAAAAAAAASVAATADPTVRMLDSGEAGRFEDVAALDAAAAAAAATATAATAAVAAAAATTTATTATLVTAAATAPTTLTAEAAAAAAAAAALQVLSEAEKATAAPAVVAFSATSAATSAAAPTVASGTMVPAAAPAAAEVFGEAGLRRTMAPAAAVAVAEATPRREVGIADSAVRPLLVEAAVHDAGGTPHGGVPVEAVIQVGAAMRGFLARKRTSEKLLERRTKQAGRAMEQEAQQPPGNGSVAGRGRMKHSILASWRGRKDGPTSPKHSDV